MLTAVPNPCRAPHQRVGDVHRERELEANRQLLEQTIQANQERVIPGLSQPSATSSSNSSSREQVLQRPQSSSSNDTARLTSQMAGVNLDQREVYQNIHEQLSFISHTQTQHLCGLPSARKISPIGTILLRGRQHNIVYAIQQYIVFWSATQYCSRGPAIHCLQGEGQYCSLPGDLVFLLL